MTTRDDHGVGEPHRPDDDRVRGLEPAQIEQFITDGFVRLDEAFPRERADAARAILWKATGCSPDDPATWTAKWTASIPMTSS